MSFPDVSIQVGFTAGASTEAYLFADDEARGLADTGTAAPDDLFADVSTDVHSFTVRRGSNRVEGPVIRYDAGQTTVVVNNSSRDYDPTNLTGPYVAGGVTQVVPMVAVREQATWAATTYDLFRGYADSWDIAYKEPRYSSVTLQASDGVKVLSSYDRMAGGAVGAGEDAGARIGRIADSAGWNTTDRVIATGDSTLQATTLEGSAWTEMLLVQDSEIGELYFDGAGRLVFRNRNAVLEDTRSNTPQAVFGDGGGAELRYEDVTPSYDDATIVNLAQVANEGGTQQVASDSTSQAQFLVHTHNRTDLLLQTNAEALNYAQFIVYQAKDPELRFAELVVNPLRDPDTLWPQVLGRDIGDRITVTRRPPGGGAAITRDVFIRGIQHDADLARRTWKTTWTLQSATRYAFMVADHADLGRSDFNAAAL